MNSNILYDSGSALNSSLVNVWGGFVAFAPRLIIAVILFIIGWVIGSLVSKAFVQVFASLKVDRAFQSIGADNVFRKAGMTLNTGYFIGQVMKWFVIVVFLLPALSLVLPADPLTGTNAVTTFLREDVLSFLPRVIIAAFILIIASIISQALSRFVSSGSRAMNVHAANLLGTIAKYAVWVFAIIIALGQLGIAREYMSILFTGLVAMLSLGGALAFGLGGKEAAARFIAKVSEETKEGPHVHM